MSPLVELLSVAPPRPIYTSDPRGEHDAKARGDIPRVTTPHGYDRDVVELYSFFHGLNGLEFAAKCFRASKPHASRYAFARHLAEQMGTP